MKTLTETIYESTTPFNNPYQGRDKKVVFVCSAGLLRSATGMRMYAHKYNTRSAGSHDEYALTPLTSNLVAWANELVFVNRENYLRACEKFNFDHPSFNEKTIRILDIPDAYPHMDKRLQQAFIDQYEAL
mgnify:FL=1